MKEKTVTKQWLSLKDIAVIYNVSRRQANRWAAEWHRNGEVKIIHSKRMTRLYWDDVTRAMERKILKPVELRG